MQNTLSVAAIKNGTVIDHITAGQGLKLVHLLDIPQCENQVTIGLNLPSKSSVKKDIIKIENFNLTEQLANEISVFAPHATINLIQDFKVSKKIKTKLPSEIKGILNCPNTNCISELEKVTSHFYIHQYNKQIILICHYCEKSFDLHLDFNKAIRS